MTVNIAVGLSESFDPVEAFAEAAAEAAARLDEPCDLALVFVAAPHLAHSKWILSAVHERLGPRHLIGCGAGGVVGAGREIEEGPGAVVWALSAPEATIATHHFEATVGESGVEVVGLPEPDEVGEAMIVLADPYSFSAESLLGWVNEHKPEIPVLGGLSSAAKAGSAVLLRDGDVLNQGAVACSLAGMPVLSCVSQGAAPLGPEMTITAADGNVICELASTSALERLREAVGGLGPDEQRLAAQGLMLGLVIDENQPAYERGDFLVRPIVGVDPDEGSITVAERVRVGQTVRLHVRDGASADADLREALRTQALALGTDGAAGALLFTCNGRGSHLFEAPDHDAVAIEDSLGAPAGGFFCAGEFGPVGGRNYLHGFTATMAVFPRR